jgi:predicted GIY-YIG superfamily endonuclease
MSKTNIYILKLEGNRYYVGYSPNVNKRIQEHIDGNGSSFTKKFKPVAVEKIKENVPEEHANVYVIKYMKKFGIDNVRGGSFKGSKLTSEQLNELSKNGIKIVEEKKNEKNEKKVEKKVEEKKKTENTNNHKVLKVEIKNANGTCYRCLMDGHYQDSCRETHDKFGNLLEGEDNVGDADELGAFFQYDPQDKKIDNGIFR